MPPTLFLLLLLLLAVAAAGGLPKFREAPVFRNGDECSSSADIIHISMTLDTTSYLRGSVAAVLSVLQHATCPENTVFHFLASSGHADLRRTITSTFPYLVFHIYPFDARVVKNKISSSVRAALDQPLNYARIYLADLLPSAVRRVIYLDSDVILVDDVSRLWSIPLHGRVLGAPEYCHANFSSYFTSSFWSHPRLSRTFRSSGSRSRRPPCYFNTGVMVIDLWRWRKGGFTAKLETWMEIQKRHRIYELGSLPPFLLVFAGSVEAVEHRWNQHGLGGDNLQGQCRDLHPGEVSLLHWSGKGKPWLRIDAERACPLDSLWAPYDLVFHPSFLPASHT